MKNYFIFLIPITKEVFTQNICIFALNITKQSKRAQYV